MMSQVDYESVDNDDIIVYWTEGRIKVGYIRNFADLGWCFTPSELGWHYNQDTMDNIAALLELLKTRPGMVLGEGYKHE